MKLLPSLKQLEYLTALAQTQHFGHAARRCNVTPSTLSTGIRDLENVLGVAIAERTKRTVFITPIGHEIAGRARQLLSDAQDLMEVAARQRDPLAAKIRLGVIPTISPFMLPAVLPILEANFHNPQLFLREEQTATLLSRLRAGELDVALIALPYDTGNLSQKILFDDPFQFACHYQHPLAERQTITDEDLANQALLLLEEGHCLRGHALEACSLHRRSPARVQFEATSLQTLVQMVASGIGVTLLPQMAIDAGLAAINNVRLIPLQTPSSRQIGLVWRPSSPRITDFELLASAFGR